MPSLTEVAPTHEDAHTFGELLSSEIIRQTPHLKLTRRVYSAKTVVTKQTRPCGEQTWSKIDHLVY